MIFAIRSALVPALLLTAATAIADHRVALLIDNSKHSDESLIIEPANFTEVSAMLEKEGFHCEAAAGLDEKQLKSRIESFADRTPTRGTALIYYRGQAVEGSYNGSDGICLLGTNSRSDRGYLVDAIFDELTKRGGSLRNWVIVDSPNQPETKGELPAGAMFAYLDAGSPTATIKLADEPSRAISPPDKLIPGKKAGDEWVDAHGMVFCWCPPGKYVAGSPDDEPGRYLDEGQREVTIDEGFWIGKYELTLSQNTRNTPRATIATDKNHPLTMLHLDDGRSIPRTLTELGRKSGALSGQWEYNLPTEEQWEYAARAGTRTAYYFGDDPKQLPEHGNFADKSYYETGDIFSSSAERTLDDGTPFLAIVGSYQANPWGLHDVYGNVAEWLADTTVRGGSWASLPASCRSAYRDHYGSRNETNFVGYRLVITPSR